VWLLGPSLAVSVDSSRGGLLACVCVCVCAAAAIRLKVVVLAPFVSSHFRRSEIVLLHIWCCFLGCLCVCMWLLLQ